MSRYKLLKRIGNVQVHGLLYHITGCMASAWRNSRRLVDNWEKLRGTKVVIDLCPQIATTRQ